MALLLRDAPHWHAVYVQRAIPPGEGSEQINYIHFFDFVRTTCALNFLILSASFSAINFIAFMKAAGSLPIFSYRLSMAEVDNKYLTLNLLVAFRYSLIAIKEPNSIFVEKT